MRESEDVQLKRETRSYFCALTEVTVKVSSKSSGSDMVSKECVVKKVVKGSVERKIDVAQKLHCSFFGELLAHRLRAPPQAFKLL